jgi:outer membrane receptor for ferrienterochelin and colicins
MIPIFEMRNVDEAYTQGVELEAEIALPYYLSLAGNTTFIDSHNDETDDDLLEVPEIKSMLRLAYDNPELGLTGNLRMNYTGKQLLSKKLEGKGDKAGGAVRDLSITTFDRSWKLGEIGSRGFGIAGQSPKNN